MHSLTAFTVVMYQLNTCF